MDNKHIGSSFDDFLKEQGLYEEVNAKAIEELCASEIKLLGGKVVYAVWWTQEYEPSYLQALYPTKEMAEWAANFHNKHPDNAGGYYSYYVQEYPLEIKATLPTFEEYPVRPAVEEDELGDEYDAN